MKIKIEPEEELVKDMLQKINGLRKYKIGIKNY